MNHGLLTPYQHAFVKEIAAQRAGFESSPMWGKMVDPHPNLKAHKELQMVMNTHEPHHIRDTPVTRELFRDARRVQGNLSAQSQIRKDKLKM